MIKCCSHCAAVNTIEPNLSSFSQKSLHPLPPESHPAAARSLKLLAKIPKDAEAVVVLVGEFLEFDKGGLEGLVFSDVNCLDALVVSNIFSLLLSGCVEFLEQTAMAFVRLNEPVMLESVLEVPVPVRFLFVLLGPSQSNMDYHEIGRSFSTLMSDKVHKYEYMLPRGLRVKQKKVSLKLLVMLQCGA